MTSEPAASQTTAVPVVIYAPGLGRSPTNTADNIAEILARSMDLQVGGQTYGTQTPQGVAAPHGLTLSKTVVDQAQNPVLQVFEFDYRTELNPSASQAAPSVTAGAVRSAALAIWGTVTLLRTFRTDAKDRRTRAQLALGLAAAGALILAALVSLYCLLVAVGVDVPWAGSALDLQANWTFGVTALGTTFTWTMLRRRILALAASTDRMISFVRDENRMASDITRKLDYALAQLTDNGWTGPVHLFGYSFGSLVFFEAVFPRRSAHVPPQPMDRVATLITVGCPVDLVRLYSPGFLTDRAKRREVVWKNVFNAADIFSSNLINGKDDQSGVGFDVDGVRPESLRYTDESIKPYQIFVTGRTHSGYWSDVNGSSCLDLVAPLFIPRTSPI